MLPVFAIKQYWKYGSICLVTQLSDAFLSGRDLRAEKISAGGSLPDSIDGISLYLEKNFKNNII